MTNRILVAIFILALIALTFFGYKQMRGTQQLNAQLAIKTQESEQLKENNKQAEAKCVAVENQLAELNAKAQALSYEVATLKEQIVKLTALKAEQATCLNENKVLEAKLKSAQADNQKLQADKQNLQNKFYTENQALRVKLKILTEKIQNLEQNLPASTASKYVIATAEV